MITLKQRIVEAYKDGSLYRKLVIRVKNKIKTLLLPPLQFLKNKINGDDYYTLANLKSLMSPPPLQHTQKMLLI
jgi:hypothetical protein